MTYTREVMSYAYIIISRKINSHLASFVSFSANMITWTYVIQDIWVNMQILRNILHLCGNMPVWPIQTSTKHILEKLVMSSPRETLKQWKNGSWNRKPLLSSCVIIRHITSFCPSHCLAWESRETSADWLKMPLSAWCWAQGPPETCQMTSNRFSLRH